ncbi:hypothetical protein GCM10027075_16810 [Streptomyces heilongjiangensis]
MTGPTPLLVLDVVGLTPRLLDHMPHLKSLRRSGSRAHLGTLLPAATCAAQSTFRTGSLPAEHGVVGDGWYFRELGEILLWRRHNALVAGNTLWDAARRARPARPVREAQGGHRPRPQEAGAAPPHGGRAPGPRASARQPRTPHPSDDDGPLLLCSTPRAVGDRLAATDVKAPLLRLAGPT